jgi:adenosine deaminase
LVEKLPKVELHLHLEGAIPLQTLYSFALKKGDTSVRDPDDLKRRLTYSNFSEFILKWVWMISFIQSEEDFEEVAYSVLRNLSMQNVRYVEAFYSPGDFRFRGLTPQGITENLIKGKERAFREFGIRSQLIVDLVRNYGPAYGGNLVKELEGYLGKGLIGVGLGGSEDHFPADAYASVYADARKRGYRLTAHAGEAAGAESIWTAIEKLGAERIGHGLRAYEDERLVSLLRERRIPLEMCVTSNVRTGVCRSFEAHPIRKYFDEGLMVTVNSDDPTMFHTSITDEYILLASRFGFDSNELRRLAMNGVGASFMPERDKERLMLDFEREFENRLDG